MKEGYIPKEQRKKILFLCDDIRSHSGVGTMAREIVLGTAHQFNWVNLGAAINHPDIGKRLDLSGDTNTHTGLEDSSVTLYPFNGYGNPMVLRQLIELEKPDVVLLFTDPRYFTWVFDIENEIRKSCMLAYLEIWDCEPGPLYNFNYYDSCDLLMAISKQTKALTEMVLGENAKDKVIRYVPHGINENHFYPVDKEKEEFKEFKKFILGDREYDFVLGFNSRNIRRKSIPDTMLAFKAFLDTLPEDKADKCCLVLHTQPIDDNGTNLYAVRDLIFGDKGETNVIFSDRRGSVEYMNHFYNLLDGCILISSNEGWGLSLTEAMMSGKMIIANVTGGMQDQMRFTNEQGKWIEFDENFSTNHLGRYRNCGEWAIPVFPSNISLQGSVPTPYIFDDRVDFRDAAKAIRELYDMPKEERERRGLEARKWVTSDESMMSADNMCKNVIDAIHTGLKSLPTRKQYHLIKVKDLPKKTLKTIVSI